MADKFMIIFYDKYFMTNIPNNNIYSEYYITITFDQLFQFHKPIWITYCINLIYILPYDLCYIILNYSQERTWTCTNENDYHQN